MSEDLEEFYSLPEETQMMLRAVVANGGVWVDEEGTEYVMTGKGWDIFYAEIEKSLKDEE